MLNMILEDRVAIVTGSGSGIGRGAALMLAREGAIVGIADRNLAGANETVDLIKETGGRAEALVFDITDDVALDQHFSRFIASHGRIDILHNHAGAQVEGNLEEVSLVGFDISWQLNVRSHFMGARHVVPHMKKAGRGVIVNTSSSSGVFYDREMIAYTTTKHAVIAMTKQMAGDYAQYGIRVNALCPGWVDTPFNAPFIGQMGGRAAIEAYVSEKVPMGRWGSVDEIAECVLFLVSDRSSYMTGQILVVDGGETLG
jgi:NAD(P)-dependent dehydrogenase (short-subunit alcohol dehydrogenase family)